MRKLLGHGGGAQSDGKGRKPAKTGPVEGESPPEIRLCTHAGE